MDVSGQGGAPAGPGTGECRPAGEPREPGEVSREVPGEASRERHPEEGSQAREGGHSEEGHAGEFVIVAVEGGAKDPEAAGPEAGR